MSGNTESDKDDSRPITPTEGDCCGNACNPCIFDVHEKLLEQWQRRKSQGIKSRGKDGNILNQVLYKKFRVVELEETADEFVRIRLEYESDVCDQDLSLFMNPGQHVILSLDEQSKPYTPIAWTRRSVELLIKIYSDGVFTNVLKNLAPGREIRIRGPYGDFFYKPNSFREIVAFCIGSGIAAIYPIARAIVDDATEETRIHLVAGFSCLARVPLRKELSRLSDYWNFTCTLHISSLGSDEACLNGAEIVRGRSTRSSVARLLQDLPVGETLILVCGTDRFNEDVETWIKDLGFTNYHTFR